MSKEIKDKATEYLRAKLSVIPTKEDKTPALQSWTHHQSESIREEEVEELFTRSYVKGLAIICGVVSGGLEVIDVDTKYDTTGALWDELRSLIEDNLPEVYSRLVIAQTKSGGYHVYYRCRSIAGNLKLANRPTTPEEREQTYKREISKGEPEEKARARANNDNVRVLIETRGEGGYVIAPPTPGYTYIQGEPGDIATITPEDREVLFSIAKSFNELEEIKPKVNTPTSSSYSATGLSPFEDYNQRGDIVTLLESRGWRVVSHRGERINLLRPGATDSKTSGNYHTGLRVLRVFSSSTEFNPDKGYSPSQVFSLLECNGDNKLTYRRLLELGYGEPYQGEGIRPTQVRTERIRVEVVNKVTRETSVISTPGESLKIENIQTAIGEEVVITSPGSEAQEEVLRAIDLIQETGKRIYIKEGAIELREYRYQLRSIFNKYGSIQEERGELTDRQRDSLLDEVVIIALRLQPVDRDVFKRDFLDQEAVKELGITEESLSITLDRIASTKEREAQAKDLDKLLSEAKSLHDKGEVTKALEMLDKQSKQIKLKDQATEIAKLQEIITEVEIVKHYREASESLRSGYTIKGEELLLPSGGLTGIAGATGHGKTDLLINLTLNAVKEYPDKEFYFFSYEMSQEAILVRFLNSYLALDLNNGPSNQREIKRYFKTGSDQYISTDKRALFSAKKEEFFRDLIHTGRLRIKGINLYAEELNNAMRSLSQSGRIGGYFIDYFQLLRPPREGHKNYSRQEELKEICQDLNDTAKELSLPIILGAQFNREVTTPLRLHATNIGEAGDIERILDTLIGIWNTNKGIVDKDLSRAEKGEIEKRGLSAPNMLYAYVLKSRETASDIWDLWEYNGKQGVIQSDTDRGGVVFK
jgi:hypothetical protein